MKLVQEQTVKVPVVVDVLCDRCQESTKNPETGLHEFGVLHANWETPTPGHPLGEKTYWELQICNSCWFEVVPGLVHPELLQEHLAEDESSRGVPPSSTFLTSETSERLVQEELAVQRTAVEQETTLQVVR